MKRRITIDQLNELTDEQKKKLNEWYKPQEGDFIALKTCGRQEWTIYTKDFDLSFCKEDLPLLDIGQMIEFLDTLQLDIYKTLGGTWSVNNLNGETFECGHVDLVDALWKAVKQLL